MPNAPTILDALWRASWQAGLMVLLILLLRYTLRDRLPAASRCRLWGLVFLRLLLPAVPASPLSLFNLLPPDPPMVRWPTQTIILHAASAALTDSLLPSASPSAARPSIPISAIVLTVWIGVTVTLLVTALVGHAIFASRVRRTKTDVPPPVAEAWRSTCCGRRVPPLVVTDAVTSPALFGLARGLLLLPPALWDRLAPTEMRLVFQHELAHVRRHDLAIGWLAVLVRCVYWFHPLVWIAVAARRADAEGACDDAVLTATADRLAYARTLLAVAGGRRVPALGMANGRTELRRRLARVASGRRAGRWSFILASGLTLAVGCATLTGADRSLVVTQTYDNSWPPDYALSGSVEAATVPITTLAAKIRNTVTPDAWGRGGVEIREVGKTVVVTAPQLTQDTIARLIAERSVQASIETRLLTLRRSALGPAGITLPSAGASTPVTDKQASTLLRLVRADRNATQLTAPRLTMFNGQTGLLTVGTQQAYVSGFNAVSKPGGPPALAPVVSTVPSVLFEENVRMTVSADRRSVDLTGHVLSTRLRSMEKQDVARTVGDQRILGAIQVPHRHEARCDLQVRLASGTAILTRPIESDLDGAGTTEVTRPSTGQDEAVELMLIRVKVLTPRPATRAIDRRP